jgi:rhodanese-related sulfurtransferase
MKANLTVSLAAALAVTALAVFVYAGGQACGSSCAPAAEKAVCASGCTCNPCPATEGKPCDPACKAKCADKSACGDKAAKCADKSACGDKAAKCADKSACADKGACADKAAKCADKAAKCADKGACGHKAGKVAHVTTEQLSGLLGAVVVVDARTAKYDDGKRIPGAISVPADATPEQIVAALPDKNAKIVTYCSGPQCPASAKLAKTLVKHGYTGVHKYPDGLAGWVAAGKQTTQAAPAGN